MRRAYDYIIVGAGSAGCVLAYRLSKDRSRNVLLVESGSPDRSPLIRIPFGLGLLMRPGNPHYWEFDVSRGQVSDKETWVTGKTLGGSSSTNGMVYVRGTPSDYNQWKANGCEGWGWEHIRQCFQSIEDHELGPGDGRGVEGPLSVTIQRDTSGLGSVFLSACEATGFAVVSDTNAEHVAHQERFGRQPQTIRAGKRASAATAFLRRAKKRPNLDVVTDADALRIEIDENKVARRVHILHNRTVHPVAASTEIILSAGALGSPKLLQLSGIGPSQTLQKYGIRVLVDAPGVGHNLMEHRPMHLNYRLRSGGHNSRLRGLGLIQSVAEYFLLRRGPLAGSVFDISGYVKTDPSLGQPDAQIGVKFFSLAHGKLDDGKTVVEALPGMTMYGTFLHPKSRGEVKIRSSDPAEKPYIEMDYVSEEEDGRRVASLFRKMRAIGSRPAFQSILDRETVPGTDCGNTDREIIDAWMNTIGGPGYHAAGTCRMGADPNSVVDPQLRVNGVRRLRVADASIMPSLPSGNTNGPTMAIAWNAANIIIGEHRERSGVQIGMKGASLPSRPSAEPSLQDGNSQHRWKAGALCA